MWTGVRVRLTYGTEEVWEEEDDGVSFDYTVRSDGFLVVHSARSEGGVDRWGHPRHTHRCEAVYPPGAWARVAGGARSESPNPGLHAISELKPERR